MSWFIILGILIVSVWLLAAVVIAVPLCLLIRWYKRTDVRRQALVAHRYGAVVSLPPAYAPRHWANWK